MSRTTIQINHFGVLPRLGLKGPGVARWLGVQSITTPSDILSAVPIAGDAWIARLAAVEYLIEGNTDSDLVSDLRGRLSPLPSGILLIPRCDVTFLLAGSNARSVFAQTCGIDFRLAQPQRLVFSRVAGVSCGILPEVTNGLINYRMWVELSYAAYLWETLAGIVTELGGMIHPQTDTCSGPHSLS